MNVPINELLAIMISLMLAAVGLGITKGRKSEAALIMFVVGMFFSAVAGLIMIAAPLILMVVLMLLLGWKYAKERY